MVEKRVFALVFCSLLAVTGWAATPSPSVIATPPQPQWSELTVQQKTVLAPLGSDWDAMEHYRRKKWIGIATRFPAIPADEQRRIQGQMQEWAKLSPEQRRLAREKFQTVSQLPAEKKQELMQKWEEYSSLPSEEKEKHKQQATSKPASKPGQTMAAGAQPAAQATTSAASTPPSPETTAPSDTATDNRPLP